MNDTKNSDVCRILDPNILGRLRDAVKVAVDEGWGWRTAEEDLNNVLDKVAKKCDYEILPTRAKMYRYEYKKK